MTKSVVTSQQFLLSFTLGKNEVRQKLGKLRKGSTCSQRSRTTGLGFDGRDHSFGNLWD